MNNLAIGVVLLILFLLGLATYRGFVDTPYGRLVRRLAAPMLKVALASPRSMFVVVYVSNLVLFLAFTVFAAVPGGALWLVPFLGVNAGILGEMFELPDSRRKHKIPTGIFFVLVVFVFMLESAILCGSAIMATEQSMVLTFDAFRSIGVLLIVGPYAAGALAISGLLEAFLAHCEPVGPRDVIEPAGRNEP